MVGLSQEPWSNKKPRNSLRPEGHQCGITERSTGPLLSSVWKGGNAFSGADGWRGMEQTSLDPQGDASEQDATLFSLNRCFLILSKSSIRSFDDRSFWWNAPSLVRFKQRSASVLRATRPADDKARRYLEPGPLLEFPGNSHDPRRINRCNGSVCYQTYSAWTPRGPHASVQALS